MTKYYIYSKDKLTDMPEKLVGWVKADSRIHAAWIAWKRWPKHSRIYVAEEEGL